MRDVIDEGCSNAFDVAFFNFSDQAAAPANVFYHLKDLTNCRTLIDWTEVNPGAALVIEIEARHNTLYSQDVGQQQNVLTVMANRGLPKQHSREFKYVIQNLKAVQ